MQWKIPDEGANFLGKLESGIAIDNRDFRALKSLNDFYLRLNTRITKLNSMNRRGLMGKSNVKGTDWIYFYIDVSSDIYESDVQRYFQFYN